MSRLTGDLSPGTHVVNPDTISRFQKAPLRRGFLVSGDLELEVRPATSSQQLSRAASAAS
jgi:hypothetical protein